MLEPDLEATVSKLRILINTDPTLTMDEIDHLIEHTSIKDLAQILRNVYWEISEELGIDWRFTALQWKIGNHGQEKFLEVCPQARFAVWSFPFREEADEKGSQKRFATCLPFQFKAEIALTQTTASIN